MGCQRTDIELQEKILQENPESGFKIDHMILSRHEGIEGSSPNYLVSLRLTQNQNSNFEESLLWAGGDES